MKKVSKLIISGIAVLSIAALAACGGQGGSREGASGDITYKIATDTTFAPFEFEDENGEYVGVDIELLAAIAKDQGFNYELQPLGFDAALQAVQSSQADAVIAGMSITDERKEIFDFSEAYYDSTVCCAVASSSSVKNLADLKGQKVAVKNGTMSAAWAESIKDEYGFTITTFDDSPTMYQDVTSGNSAACFEDTPVMSYGISTGNVDLTIIDEAEATSEFATPYGFAVNKGANTELLKMFNDGLANIKADGTYDEIISKYVQSVAK